MADQISLGQNGNNGKIDFNRIKAGVKKEEIVKNDERLASVFDMVDADGDGILSRAELDELKRSVSELAGNDGNLDDKELKDFGDKKLGRKDRKALLEFLNKLDGVTPEDVQKVETKRVDNQQVEVVTFKDGHTEEYYPDGQKISVVVQGNKKTRTTEKNGEVTSEVVTENEGEENEIISTTSTVNGQKQTVINDKGDKTTTTINYNGDKKSDTTIVKENSTTVITYDSEGNPANETETVGTTEKTYIYQDGQKVLQSVIENKGLDGKETTKVYDSEGNCTQTKEVANGKITTVVDKDGNITSNVKTETINGQEVSLQLDKDGNIPGVIVQNGESSAAIAKKFGCSVDELMELNADQLKGKGKNKYFEVGSEIKLPGSVSIEKFNKASEGRKTAEVAKQEYARDAEIRRQKAAEKEEAALKELGMTERADGEVQAHYAKTPNKTVTFKKVANANNERSICVDQNGNYVVVAKDGTILKTDYVKNPEKYEQARKYNENVAIRKNAENLAQQFYQIADDNSGLNSMKKMQELLDNQIDEKNIVAFLDAYDREKTKQGDSSIIDTVTSEVGAGGSKQQRDVLMTIMEKLSSAAEQAGVSADDIKKAQTDFEASLDKEFNALRRTNPKDMEKAIDFLRGAIASKANGGGEISEQDAINQFNSTFSAENATAQKDYKEARENEGWTAKVGDTVCGWFGCNTIKDMDKKLGANAEAVQKLANSKTEAEFKKNYKEVFGIDFDKDKIAARQTAIDKYNLAQNCNSTIKLTDKVLESSGSYSDLKTSLKNNFKYDDATINQIIDSYAAQTGKNKATDDEKKELLIKFLQDTKANASQNFRTVTNGKTLEQMGKDIDLITRSAFGTNDIVKDVIQFNENQQTTEMVTEAAFEIAGTVALQFVPGLGQMAAARLAVSAARWGTKSVRVANYAMKAEKAFTAANKFQKGEVIANAATKTSKVVNKGAQVASQMVNTGIATAGVDLSNGKSVKEATEKALMNMTFAGVGASSSVLAPKLMQTFKINSALANEIAEEIINAAGSYGVTKLQGGEYGSQDAFIDFASGLIISRLSHVKEVKQHSGSGSVDSGHPAAGSLDGDGVRVGDDVRIAEGNGVKVDEGNGVKVDEGNGVKVDEGNGVKVDEGNGVKVDEGNGVKVDEGNGVKVDEGNGVKVDEGNGVKVDEGNGVKVDEGNGVKVDEGNGVKVDEGNGGKVDEGNGSKVGSTKPKVLDENIETLKIEINGKTIEISKAEITWEEDATGTFVAKIGKQYSTEYLTKEFKNPQLAEVFADKYNGLKIDAEFMARIYDLDSELSMINDVQMKQLILDEISTSTKNNGYIKLNDFEFLVDAQNAFEARSAILSGGDPYGRKSAMVRFNEYLKKENINPNEILSSDSPTISGKKPVGISADYKLENRLYGIRQYMKMHPNSQISNYMYSKYLDELATIGVDKSVIDKCRRLDSEYGCKVMVSANLKEASDVMNYLEVEFNEWKTASNGQAKIPPVIDFSTAKYDWYDQNRAYGQGTAAAFAESAASGSLAFSHMEVGNSGVHWAIRHEMTHTNDLKRGSNIPPQYDLNKIMPKKPKLDQNGNPVMRNGQPVMVPDFENCMFVDEFKKAGISPGHIPYAYNNTLEFIAVAAEGDLSKCSPEFRQMLVDFGMPEWQLNMKPKTSVITQSRTITANENRVFADLEMDYYNPERGGISGFFNKLLGNDIREQGNFHYTPPRLESIPSKVLDDSGLYIGNRVNVLGDKLEGNLPKGKAFVVAGDAKIRLSDTWTLDLDDPQIKKILGELEEGRVLTVGRKGNIKCPSSLMGVSANHLEIRKIDGEIVVRNLSDRSAEILGTTGTARSLQLARRMKNYVAGIADTDIPVSMQDAWKKCKSEISDLTDAFSMPDLNINTAALKSKYHSIMNGLSTIASKASQTVKEQIKKLRDKIKEMFNSLGISNNRINPNITGRPDLDKYVTPNNTSFRISRENRELAQTFGVDDSHVQFIQDNKELFEKNVNYGYWQGNQPADQHHGAWKMHLFSVDEADWQKMSQTLIPYLNEHGIEWKTLNMMHDVSHLNGSIQQGKAFTIYPRDNAHMEQVARDLDYIIKRNNLDINSSDIVGDRQMGNSGRLFYRYEFNTKQAQNEVLDLSNRADYERYISLYDSNEGRVNRHGQGSYLADDMTAADDPWLNFDPGNANSKPGLGQGVQNQGISRPSGRIYAKRLPKGEGVVVNSNSKLLLSDRVELDLSSPEIQAKIKNLKDGETLSVGRSSDSDIVLTDSSISRKHLTIQKYGDEVIIIDNSTNGTKFSEIGYNQDKVVNPIDQSNKFAKTSRIEAGEVISDGYRDGGRGRTFDANGKISSAGREIVLVDRTKDRKLQAIISDVKAKTANMNDKQKAAFLQQYIHNMTGDGSIASRNCDSWDRQFRGRDVLLGDIVTNKPPVAVCRHRSLLYKILGDEVGLKVELQRGNFYSAKGSGGGHAWNTVRFNDGTSAIFDAMHNKTSSTTPGRVDNYALQYYTVDNQDLYSNGLHPQSGEPAPIRANEPAPNEPMPAPAPQVERVSVLNDLEKKYLPKYTKYPEQTQELLDTISTRIKNGEIPCEEMLNEILEDISLKSGISIRELTRDFDKSMTVLGSDWQNLKKALKQPLEYNQEALEVGRNSTARNINNFKEKRGLLSDSELQAKQESQLRAKQEAELKAQQEAQIKTQREAELKAQQEAQIKTQREAELKAQREAQINAQREARRLSQEKLEKFAEKYPEVVADGAFRDPDSAVKLIDLMEKYDLQMSYGDFNPQAVYREISMAGIKNDADMDTAFDMIKKRFHADVIAEEARIANINSQYKFYSKNESISHADRVINKLKQMSANNEKFTMDDIENMLYENIYDVRDFNGMRQMVLDDPDLKPILNENLHLDVYSNPKYKSCEDAIPNAMTILDNILADIKNGETLTLDLINKHYGALDTKLRANGGYVSTESLWVLQDVIRSHEILGPQSKDFVEDIVQGGF